MFGSPHPHTALVEQDGKLRIRALVVDPADAPEPTTPEQYYGAGKPTGTIHVEAATRDELVAQMRAMKWPDDW